MGPGSLYNESILTSPAGALPARLVAHTPGTTVVAFELTRIRQALGAPGKLAWLDWGVIGQGRAGFMFVSGHVGMWDMLACGNQPCGVATHFHSLTMCDQV